MKEFSWGLIPVKVGVTADPVAGAQIANIVVPANKRWVVQSLEATCVADATVVNRQPHLIIRTDGTNTTYETNVGASVAASQTKRQSFIVDSLIVTVGTLSGMHIPWLELPAAAVIIFYYDNLQAGDNVIAATYFYKEVPA